MIKLQNSVNDLVENTKTKIRNLTLEEAIILHDDTNNLFIDLRDIREITKSGRILGAKHVPRGMLEFWIDPNSPYYKEFLTKIFILFFIVPQGGDLLYLFKQQII